MGKSTRATVCALLLTTSQTALAQAADADNLDSAASEQPNIAETAQAGLEDIIVTATRREERLQQVPVAVTAITAQSLAAADIASIRNLTQVIPGFIGSRNQGVFQPVIRGVGSTGISIGDEPNVATYIDGIYQPESASTFIDLVEVERVEVLRGPQGTVFGRNATGGLINVITPDPSFTARGRAAVRYGRTRNDASDYDARVYLTGPLSQSFAADFAGLYRKNDGYIKDLVRGGTLGDSEIVDLRSKVLFEPDDIGKIVLTAEYFNQNSTTNSPQPLRNASDGLYNTAGRRFAGVILPTGAWQASLTKVPRLDIERVNLALKMKFDLGGVELEASTGFLDLLFDQETDSDSSNILLGNFPAIFKTQTLSQEIRLLSTGSGPFKWTAGVYFYDFGGNSPFKIETSTNGATVTSTLNFFPQLSTRSYAGFAEGTYELAASLFLTLGGRYTTEDRSFTQIINGQVIFGKVEKSFNKWTYRAALRYEFSDDANIYASYGTGFKSGVFNMAGTSPVAVDPETIKALEAGIKADPLPWLRTNLSVYHYDYKGLQVQARDANGVSYILQNAANAKIYGGEFEVTAKPVPNLNLRGSVAYTHARYRDFLLSQSFIPRSDGGNFVVTLDASGKVMTRAPKLTYNLGFDLGQDIGNGRLALAGNLYHSSRLYYDFQNLVSQAPYTLVNGQFSYSLLDDALKLSLWATNLTNARVLQTVRPGALATDGFYEPPRRIGVGVETRF